MDYISSDPGKLQKTATTFTHFPPVVADHMEEIIAAMGDNYHVLLLIPEHVVLLSKAPTKSGKDFDISFYQYGTKEKGTIGPGKLNYKGFLAFKI